MYGRESEPIHPIPSYEIIDTGIKKWRRLVSTIFSIGDSDPLVSRFGLVSPARLASPVQNHSEFRQVVDFLEKSIFWLC